MSRIKFFFVFAITILFFECADSEKKSVEHGASVPLKYASGFSIDKFEKYTRVDVVSPFQGSTSVLEYYLVPKGSEPLEHLADKIVVEVPINSIVCTSTTHIPILEYLGVAETLKGFPNTDYISSAIVREMVANEEVIDLGHEKGMNIEKLLALEPELVMSYLVSGDLGQLGQIDKMGIPVIINAEYLEPHPLGRAEWIKFVGAFYDLSKKADSIFSDIEDRYNVIRDKANNATKSPTVLSGVVYGDTWFLPGGQNYAAKIIKDAGGNYLWKEDSSSGFLELGFEIVYKKASEADYWIGTASYNSLDELNNGDERYSMFDSYKSKNVFSYNKRIGAKGGNEYLELGYLRPDLILNDLVMILHPEYYREDELFFFMPLK